MSWSKLESKWKKSEGGSACEPLGVQLLLADCWVQFQDSNRHCLSEEGPHFGKNSRQGVWCVGRRTKKSVRPHWASVSLSVQCPTH